MGIIGCQCYSITEHLFQYDQHLLLTGKQMKGHIHKNVPNYANVYYWLKCSEK